ncbi:uncharacterized protein LOC123037310 [Drosophila rhopaloa]|uniref:Integrase catalytic domain-containing protein n=1 Tax=Drosophila rhopaloa TaxID=1041015 RepID=A0ABM5J3B3_DRORH|nr:uncharacterized protein LOC123037310 [Drosophila rhopaloa]
MLTQVPEEPWATVCADFVRPLPRSKHGNQMLLVLIDRFSKWTELVPLRTATAETLQKAFKERIIARFGVPKVVITENGVQFASRAFKKFLHDMGIKQQFKAPYTPQENPTERANRTVKKKAAQDQARHYNLRRRQWNPRVGDVVWAKEHHLSEAAVVFAAKLAPRYDGPYQVVDFVSPVICKIRHQRSKKERTVHISDLKQQEKAHEADEDGDTGRSQAVEEKEREIGQTEDISFNRQANAEPPVSKTAWDSSNRLIVSPKPESTEHATNEQGLRHASTHLSQRRIKDRDCENPFNRQDKAGVNGKGMPKPESTEHAANEQGL